MTDKKVILTGIRANNDLHIGNFFGAIKPTVDMAEKHAGEYQINLFVPDLHSFTTPINHELLQGQILNTLRVFVASGLPIKHNDVHIYRQSYIPAHSELTWILNCFTRFGELNRMTQYKDKIKFTEKEKKHLIDKISSHLYKTYENNPEAAKVLTIATIREIAIQAIEENEEMINQIKSERASVGLFDYPVLMASDILLYNTTYVPVGDDQTQHLEFTRDIAQRMNSRFATEIFTIPVEVKKQHELFKKDQGLRIMDLADPSKKMSKSDATGKGVIFLSDTPEQARKKIMSATTDSESLVVYDPKTRPGLSNLIDILALLENTTPEDVAKRYEGQTMYGPIKQELADKIVQFLNDFQSSMKQVDDEVVLAKLTSSEQSMNQVAKATLERVQKAVGLR